MNLAHRKNSSTRIMLVLSLLLTVSLSNSWAQAQQMCAEMFATESPGRALGKMDRLSNLLTKKYMVPQDMTRAELEFDVREVEKATEEFLIASEIGYQKVTDTFKVAKLKDEGSFVLSHLTYSLKGAASGNRISKLLNGVQIHPDFKSAGLSVILDPLYDVKFSSGAHFWPTRPAIVIRPQEFTLNLFALGSPLRHEVQHFIEQVKLKKGEHTLARIELINSQKKSSEDYSDYLAVDEIESHLRDVRYYDNVPHQERRDAMLEKSGIPVEHLAILKSQRLEQLDLKLSTLQRLKTDVRAVLQRMQRGSSEMISWVSFRNDPANADVGPTFFISASYDTVKLNLYKRLSPDDAKNPLKIRDASLEVLTWTLQRLDRLDQQLQIRNAKKK